MTIDKLIFNPSNHTYTYGESPVPSVTQLIKLMNGNPYKSVPPHILEKAARYGDKVHGIIENYSMGSPIGEPDGYEGIAFRRYKVLESRHDIVITSTEQRLLYMDGDLPLFAGTYDMVGSVSGKIALIDIKTTAEYHGDDVKLQLAMYKQALEQMNNALHFDKCYCLWLPKKGLGKLLEVEVPPFDTISDKIHNAYTKYFGATDEESIGQQQVLDTSE